MCSGKSDFPRAVSPSNHKPQQATSQLCVCPVPADGQGNIPCRDFHVVRARLSQLWESRGHVCLQVSEYFIVKYEKSTLWSFKNISGTAKTRKMGDRLFIWDYLVLVQHFLLAKFLVKLESVVFP